MTTPNNENLITEHDDKLVRMMEQAHASSLIQMDAIKVRVSHYEKLVGLCAGTLALSFTAATAVHTQHTQQVTALPSLFHAWQLLLGAIVLGVASNWLSVNGMANLANFLGRKQIETYFYILLPVLTKLVPDYAKKEQESLERNSAKLARVEKTGNALVRIASIFGLLAQIAAFCAFVSLYNFAKSVLVG